MEKSVISSLFDGTSVPAEVLKQWHALIARQSGLSVLYQSQSFYNYLATTENLNDLGIVALNRQNSTVGIVPFHRMKLPIPYSIGPLLFHKITPALRVLGSEPMILAEQQLFDALFLALVSQLKRASLIEMDSVTEHGALWNYIQSSQVVKSHFLIHVLHGVRDCHYVPIPESADAYNRRLSKKTRYNLKRQERLLQQHLDAPLKLILLSSEKDVPFLISALKYLRAPKGDWHGQQEKLYAAAKHGFLACYVLCAGNRVVGLARGSGFGTTLRIHKFYHDRNLEKYSAGTTTWQFVLRRLIDEQVYKTVDMGYGTPAYPFSSTNGIRRRGTILLFRKSWINRVQIFMLASLSFAVRILRKS